MKRFRNAMVLGLMTALGAVATAQTYPEPGKAIRFVVGFPPGSSIDTVARTVLDNIRARTHATILVENKPGALGLIGSETVVRSAPDGYTLMPSSSATHSSAPHLSKATQRLDAVNDFTHVAKMVRFDVVVVGNPGQGHVKAADLIAAGKARPKGLTYGYGSGTGQAVGASFNRAAGIDAVGVAYKGQPQALTDLLAGGIHFVAADLGATLPLLRSNKLVAFLFTGSKRSTILPNVPTANELGLTGLDMAGWVGLSGPAGLPPNVVAWWTAQINTALNTPDVAERLKNIGMEPDPLSGGEFTAFVRDQLRNWGKQIQDAGMQPE